MITAYPARTDDPLVAVEIPHIALVELTPDEARDLAEALGHAAGLCETACAMPRCSRHRLDDSGGMCAEHGG